MSSITRIPAPYSYSSAVAAGEYVFVGLHRGFGDTFGAQFEGVFAAMRQTLAKFDLTLSSLVKVNVWLENIKDLPEMEKRFRDHFEEAGFPARMTATTAFIDDDCLLMIEGVAYAEG